MWSRSALSWCLPISVLATFLLFWISALPLGVPGEWTWDRVPWHFGMEWSLVTLLLAGGLYLTLAIWGERRIEISTAGERRLWWLMLFLSAWIMTRAAIDSAPPPADQSRGIWVLYYPGPSGYYTVASASRDQRSRFLREYESFVRQGDVLHLGTHPPGLIVSYWLLFDLVQHLPGLTPFQDWSLSDNARSTWHLIQRRELARGQVLPTSDRDALWLASGLVQVIGLLLIWPLGRWLSVIHAPRIAWRVVCFWPLVPSLCLFWPKSDLLFPTIGLLLGWLWWQALERRSLLAAAVWGLVLFLGLELSLALLTVVVWLGLATFLQLLTRNAARLPWRAAWPGIAVAGLCLGGLIAVTATAGGFNPLTVWRQNLQNHAGFYEHYPRSYWPWLLINPIELAPSGRLPVSMVTIAAAGRWFAEWRRSRSPAAPVEFRFQLTLLAAGLTWLLLWISGKNMGEAARLWLVIMPWGLLILSRLWTSEESSMQRRDASTVEPPPAERVPAAAVPDSERFEQERRIWQLALVCQLLALAVTITRVSGFMLH